MGKRVFVIHRWGGNPESDWYSWLKKELEGKGFEVHIPEMPNTDEPKIEKWISHLSKLARNLDEDTYFIGHSIGCQTIMRYLETLPENTKVGGAVFVAGWFKLGNLEDDEVKQVARPWLEKAVNFSKVKRHLKKMTVILSSNDPYGFVSDNAKLFKDLLGAEVIIKKNKGHFTEDDGIKELPSALKALLKLAS